MPTKDKKVDAYIAKAQPFAQPILKHIRGLVHKACPDVEEKIKWGFPNFDYNGIMCNMASFKAHCAFGFWKQKLMKDPHKIFDDTQAMGHLGKITSIKDLPSDKIMLAYIEEAASLNKEGIKLPPRVKKVLDGKSLVVPDYFKKALTKNAKASKVFEAFSPSQKKEYIDWLTDAKTEETRNSRMVLAVEWISEGKIRNWKYVKK
jgi:uncharacterized protein YdeI (YjbR/CyaY-like superfamily)